MSIVITAQDGTVGLDGFFDEARGLLQEAGLEDAQVRVLRDRRGGSDGRLLCHVYAGSTGLRHAEPRWAWASPPVGSPEQLRDALASALRLRRLEDRPARLRSDPGSPRPATVRR